MNIKAVIIDDQIDNIRLLSHYINKYSTQINVVGSTSCFNEVNELIIRMRPDVVFLDIKLGTRSSFDLLKNLTFKRFKFIFVTAFDEYAIKAFKYNAFDYLLKPIKIEDIIRVTAKLQQELYNNNTLVSKQVSGMLKLFDNSNQQTSIAVASVDKVDVIKLEDIVFLQSDGRYTSFYLSNKRIIVSSKNLGEYEEIITSPNFYRIHKSYIINISYLTSINKSDGVYCELEFVDNKLPVSVRKQENFYRFLKLKKPKAQSS